MNAYQALEKVFTKLHHLSHLNNIASWDEAVMMPTGGGQARADALATLSVIYHDTLIDPKVGELLDQAHALSLDSPWQQANLRLMTKQYNDATCLPHTLVEAIKKSQVQCEQAWRSMRADNDWKSFAPLLENMFKLTQESAVLRAEQRQIDPYDVVIDEYSPGITQALIDPIFSELEATLPDLLQQIMAHQTDQTTIAIKAPFDIAQQKKLSLELMSSIGFDRQHGRLDVSHHPFCGGVPEDVRMTTRYNEQEFMSAMMGVCHETGHACYEQQLPQAWLTQPVGAAFGMSIHESQSLLIEMQACRSAEFMALLTPKVIQHFGSQAAFTEANLHRLHTRVQPSLIRVDADEVSYPLHVILRYKIEQHLFSGALQIKDLPDAWDQQMTQHLGLSTKGNDKDGVMQDVHWSSGAFGYFPAYTLGSLIAAQLFTAAKKAHPDIPTQIQQGDFKPLQQWLCQHIHSQGSLLDFSTLIENASGEALNPRYFIDHLKKRYLED